MTKDLILVGTSHEFQFGTASAGCAPDEAAAFRARLRQLCDAGPAKVIAEEMSLAALKRYDLAESVPYALAAELRLEHCYCEPSPAEQVALGIEEEGALGLLALPPPLGSSMSATDLRARRRNTRLMREREWLGRLLHLNVWPAVFICGSWHVPTFSESLRLADVRVQVADLNWGDRPMEDDC